MLYDLGVNGDHEGMYAWMDNQGAKECGSSVAYFQFTHEGALPAALKKRDRGRRGLEQAVKDIRHLQKDEKISGRYLIGHRKGAPWQGFGDRDEIEEDLGDTQ